MNTRSANLAQMDAQWRAYVNADPDLHRLEQRKRAIAHRQIRREHAKRVRREAGREIISTLTEAAIRFTICTVGAFLFLLLLVL